MPSDQNHPFTSALQSCLALPDQAETIHEIATWKIVRSVATYVVTHDGEALLLHKPGKGKNTKKLRAFGGCDFPNNLFVRMNSLRLELMDEGSLLWNEDSNVAKSTPILVQRHPDYTDGSLLLLQAVQLQADGVRLPDGKLRDLFSLEAANCNENNKYSSNLEVALQSYPDSLRFA